MDNKSCWNCGLSYRMCGELICRWHESYVCATGKCPWWTKKVKENDK